MEMVSNQQAHQHGAVKSPNKPQMKEAMRVKSTLTLSILLVLAGAFMSVIQIACTVVAKEEELWGTAHNGGTGIWCGVLILFSGILGLQAASRKTNPWVISFLVLNVLSVSALAPTMIGLTGVDLATNRWSFCRSYHHDYRFDCSYWNTLIGMTIFLLLDAIFVFAISIWGIVMNSIAIQQVKACSCHKDVISQARTVVYIHGDQMPSTMAGQSGQQYFPHEASSPSYILPMNGAPISPPSCTNQPPHVVGTPISAMSQPTYVVAQAPYPVASSIGQTGQSTNIVASTQTTLPETAFSGIGGPPAYERLN